MRRLFIATILLGFLASVGSAAAIDWMMARALYRGPQPCLSVRLGFLINRNRSTENRPAACREGR
jgi:hypothetical protein